MYEKPMWVVAAVILLSIGVLGAGLKYLETGNKGTADLNVADWNGSKIETVKEDVMPDTVRIFARYIFYSQVTFDRVTVLNRRQYMDEALIEIQLNHGHLKKPHVKQVFLNWLDSEWKIVGISTKLESESQRQFIKFGEPCEN